MSHFYGTMQGNRGSTSRCGSKASGIEAHVRGWNVGVRVSVRVGLDGQDVAEAWRTSGSNGDGGDQLIARFMSFEEPVQQPTSPARFAGSTPVQAFELTEREYHGIREPAS